MDPTASTTPPAGTGLPAGSVGELDVLRTDLAAAELTHEGVRALLGATADAALHREQRLPALRVARAAGRDARAAAVLLRLFVLGDEVARGDLDAALAGTGTGGAVRLGLVEAAGADRADPVRALVDLHPYAAEDAAGQSQWWIASDRGELATGAALRADHVLGVGGASLTLAQLTVREPMGRALDLGTGCGIQALHAARHSGTVVATDISARALGFAAFNAGLAGVGLDLRAGSMLDPVAGELFDLVVSNPPFVITPEAAYAAGLPVMEYRDGGRGGDDLLRDLVVGLGDVLAPGGLAQLLGNWEHRRGEDAHERLRSWLADAGLDGWVVEREVQDPAEYAELWLRDGGLDPQADRSTYEGAYAAWLDDFEARGVEAVGFGYVTLRRPPAAGQPWRRVEAITGPVRQPLGPHVTEVLTAHDWLAGLDARTLSTQHLVVPPDVTEERYLTPGAGEPRIIQLRQGGGLGRTVPVGTALAAFVGACDGELSVGQITTALAALLEVDAQSLAAELDTQVRELLLGGLLRPA